MIQLCRCDRARSNSENGKSSCWKRLGSQRIQIHANEPMTGAVDGICADCVKSNAIGVISRGGRVETTS